MRLALAAARATAFASRASGRGGGTTLPGRVLDGARARRAAAARGAAAARLRARLGHERQDDDLRAARRGAARARRSWRATAPAPTSPPASRRRSRCARRRAAELGLFECDEAALPAIAAAARAARDRARQPLPRPARPLRRARARGRALARAGRAPRARRRRSSWPPTTRSPPSLVEGHAGRRALRHRRSLGRAAGRARTPPTRASACAAGTPYDYRAAYVGHLSDYRCPSCGNARAPLDLAARAIELRGLDGTAFDLCRGDERVRVELAAARPLQRRERARGGARSRSSLGEPLDGHRRRARRASAARSGASSGCASPTPSWCCC